MTSWQSSKSGRWSEARILEISASTRISSIIASISTSGSCRSSGHVVMTGSSGVGVLLRLVATSSPDLSVPITDCLPDVALPSSPPALMGFAIGKSWKWWGSGRIEVLGTSANHVFFFFLKNWAAYNFKKIVPVPKFCRKVCPHQNFDAMPCLRIPRYLFFACVLGRVNFCFFVFK